MPNKAVKIGLKNSGQPRQPISANFPTKKFVLVWQYSVIHTYILCSKLELVPSSVSASIATVVVEHMIMYPLMANWLISIIDIFRLRRANSDAGWKWGWGWWPPFPSLAIQGGWPSSQAMFIPSLLLSTPLQPKHSAEPRWELKSLWCGNCRRHQVC